MGESNQLIVLPSAPDLSESYSALDGEIAGAIALAQENLLRQQKPDGHWCGELLVDSTLCSDYVVFMHWCGEVDSQPQRRCVRHILKRQLPDGGWNIYHGGPSEINASVKAYFALKLAGCSVDAPFMREARANIMRRGGIPQMNTFSKLYLALLGQFPWKYLPTIPVEMVLLPTWAPFHIYKMSSWSRAMLVPLAIINHFKPTRELPGETQLHELYPFGTDHKDFRIQPCLSPVWDTAINIIALAESGLPAEHPSLQKAAAWLSNKEVRFRGDWARNNPHPDASGWAFEYNNVYYPDTDDTAMVLMALRLVHPKDKNSYEDLFQRALAWQLSFQCRDGGWAAFDKDVIDGWLENMPFADHNAILDPSCSDLTARTIELFGYINFDRGDASVENAIRYLIVW